MLPYDEDNEPDDRPTAFNYDDSIYGDLEQAQGIWDTLQDNWAPNEGGFDASQIFDMIYEIDNFDSWEDEDGNMHYSFDYEWESEDGSYHGSGHYSS
jgi:hypothetical protein